MVPKPVLAVIMCFPITKEVDALAKEGTPRPHPLLLSTHQSCTLHTDCMAAVILHHRHSGPLHVPATQVAFWQHTHSLVF